MAERVASIFAEIGLDASKFTDSAGKVVDQLGKVTEAFGISAEEAATFGSALSVLAAGVAAQISAEKAMHESLMQNAKLEAVLKATGGAVKMTAKELEDYAYQLARINGLDDEAVVAAEAVAITFSNMSRETFPRVMQTAVDMSAVLDTDVKGSVDKLGMALNTFDGFTKLGRTIGNFSDEQKKTISNFEKNNDLAGYQSYLLDILQKKYDGTGKAMNDASDGSANLALEWGNLQENLGTLSPMLGDFNRNLAGIFKTINDNFGVVQGLYNGLVRIRLAFMTLGISEVIRGFQTLFGVINAGMSGGAGAVWDKLFPPKSASGATTSDNPLGASATTTHAIGGSFLIPQSYGREGFRLGNGDTASAGERVTITPAYGGSNAPSISIANLTIGDTSGLTRSDIQEMFTKALFEVAR